MADFTGFYLTEVFEYNTKTFNLAESACMHFLRLKLEEQGFLGLSYSKLTLLGQGIRYLDKLR